MHVNKRKNKRVHHKLEIQEHHQKFENTGTPSSQQQKQLTKIIKNGYSRVLLLRHPHNLARETINMRRRELFGPVYAGLPPKLFYVICHSP